MGWEGEGYAARLYFYFVLFSLFSRPRASGIGHRVILIFLHNRGMLRRSRCVLIFL